MLGRIKRVGNLDREQGENHEYLYVKVQLPHGGEEHWLLTDNELRTAQENHRHYGLASPPDRLGQVDLQEELVDVRDEEGNVYDRAPRRSWYVVQALHCGSLVALALEDLERIRVRVENNREDVEANAPGWLADLAD